MTAPVRPPAPGRPTAPELWTLAAVVVVAALVRFVSLDAASYWLDEAYSVVAVRGSLDGAWHAIVTTESTPPLYYLLGWGWAEVFGTSAFGLRSLSALLGVALVPAVWLAAHELISRRGALIAAALVTVNPLLVWYAQEARAYALVTLLCVLAVWQLARVRRGASHAVLWWAVAAALALTAHYVAVFPVAVEAALLLWWRRDRAAVLATAAVAVIGALLVPLIVTQRGNALANEGTGRPLRQVAETLKQFAVGYDLPWEVAAASVGLALLVTGAALVALTGERTRQGASLAALVAAASPVGLVLLYLVGQNQLMSRYMLPALPLVLIVVAAGFGARRAGRYGLVGAAALCTVGLAVTVAVAVTPADRAREDWHGAVAAASAPRLPRALVVFPPSGALPLSLYVPDLHLAPPRFTAREIDFVDVTRDPAVRAEVSAFPDPLTDNPGFRLERVRRTSTYTVARYVAAAPTVVFGVSVAGKQVGGRQSTVLIQR